MGYSLRLKPIDRNHLPTSWDIQAGDPGTPKITRSQDTHAAKIPSDHQGDVATPAAPKTSDKYLDVHGSDRN